MSSELLMCGEGVHSNVLLHLVATCLDVLKYVCVRDVMDVVFSVCIVTRGAVGARVCDV